MPFEVCCPAVAAATYRYSAPPLPAAGTDGTATQDVVIVGSKMLAAPAARAVGVTELQFSDGGLLPVVSLPQPARSVTATVEMSASLGDTEGALRQGCGPATSQ